MKTNICDVCMGNNSSIKLGSLRIRFGTSIGKHIIDLCKEHENYFKECGFEELTTENEAEFYKFLTELMHKVQQNYHKTAYHHSPE